MFSARGTIPHVIFEAARRCLVAARASRVVMGSKFQQAEHPADYSV